MGRSGFPSSWELFSGVTASDRRNSAVQMEVVCIHRIFPLKLYLKLHHTNMDSGNRRGLSKTKLVKMIPPLHLFYFLDLDPIRTTRSAVLEVCVTLQQNTI